MKSIYKKSSLVVQALLLMVVPVIISTNIYAQELALRSIEISSSIPSAPVVHRISFSALSLVSIGSIEFEHCTNSPIIGMPCSPPSGLALNGAVLSNQTNNVGFSIDVPNSTANKIVLARAPSVMLAGQSMYEFSSFLNPNAAIGTTFVRIVTYASIDATGPRTDIGAVTYTIQDAFSVGVYVPPFLIFCAGATVANDCSSLGSVLLTFGELSSTQTKTATSQFSGATNDPSGYSVTVSGQTMTAGNYVIPALEPSGTSTVGARQFGINLRSNTAPLVGANPTGAGSASPNANYNTPNIFRFVNGEQLVNSPLPTDFNTHTVSYIVNISSAQQPGYYATTFTYIATAAF